MAITKFTPRAVPIDASPQLRSFLDEQMRRLQVLVNAAPSVDEDETITGEWTFTNNGIGITIESISPVFQLVDTNAPTDETRYRLVNNSGNFGIVARDDADALGSVVFQIQRSGMTIDEIELNATNVDINAAVDISGNLTLPSGNALAIDLNGTLDHDRARFTAMNRWRNTSDSNTIQTSWRTEAATGSFWGFIPEPSGSADLNAGFGYDFTDDTWMVDDGTTFTTKGPLIAQGSGALVKFGNSQSSTPTVGSLPAIYRVTSGYPGVATGGLVLHARDDNSSGSEVAVNAYDGSSRKIALRVRATDILAQVPIYISEQAAASTALTGRGQLWVKNTTPCQLWFTDDAGNDTQIV